MRKIEKVLAPKFFNGESATISNTTIRNKEMYLFGNKIAWVEGNKLFFTLCGWNTVTTRSRLNALGVQVSQINGVPVWNGQEIDANGVYEQEI